MRFSWLRFKMERCSQFRTNADGISLVVIWREKNSHSWHFSEKFLRRAGAVVNNAKPYAILSSSTSSKVMLFFASNSIKLVEFVPSEDALARDLLSLKELLSRYYGDKDFLQSLIENGQKQN